ncbi:MAG TPA: hypothetical protein VHW72_07190 [Candidatus Angelobacter sp.]|nr:hypothetical protein [Candidatus Angelobacter sp.]
MPITDPEGYATGHFRRVFEDIFVPACAAASHTAVRADDVRATNLIHLDVLQRLLHAPVALCDLSSRNPNVLFELGLRQAFDKPVVLVQESGTAQIFDIAPLRHTEYRRARLYNEVLEDQKKIAGAITATLEAYEKNEGVNSLVKILGLTKPASLSAVEAADSDPAMQIIRAEVNELKLEIRRFVQKFDNSSSTEASILGLSGGDPARLPFSGLQARILAFMIKHPGWMTADSLAKVIGMNELVITKALTKMQNRGLVALGINDGTSVYRIAIPAQQSLSEEQPDADSTH